MLFQSAVDAIGHTPLVRLRGCAPDGVEMYAKLEAQNLYGMKDRVARSTILAARRSGVLAEGAPIIESSSGTMALGVALVGTMLGHPVHIVTDPRIDKITLAKLRALGCEVHVVESMSGAGWQSARLERLAELRERLSGAFWPDQYSNPDNPAGYRGLADELLEDLGPFDVLVGSVGSGGSLCGSARVLRERLPGLRVVGVDTVGSVLFDQPDVPGRLQSGLGNSLHPKNLDRRLIDEVHWLNDHEAFQSARDVAREQGFFVGNTSGSVYQVLKSVGREARPGTRIVGIFPDRGDRYIDTVYSDEYWALHRLRDMALAAAPHDIERGEVARGWARLSRPAPPGRREYLLFVESNTTGTGMLSLLTARGLGVEPVLLASQPERYAGLGDTGCEVLRCDTGSLSELRRAVLDRFCREELAGITTTSEFYVEAVAELAEWLGLPGNPPDAVRACRNKAALREKLRAQGVMQPLSVAVTSKEEVADAVALVTLPCVVKPADDTGSYNVLLCATLEEATAHVARILAIETNARGLPAMRTALVEQYLDAPECSVETFNWEGRVNCIGITEKSVTGLPYFVEHRHVFPASVSSTAAAEIEATVVRAIETVGLRHGAAHTEIRLTSEGPAIIEINPRPAGGMIPEAVRLATGTDLLEEQMRAVTGLSPRLKTTAMRSTVIQFLLPDRSGQFVGVRGLAEAQAVEGVEQVSVTARPGASLSPARSAYDRAAFIIASGDSYEQAIKNCAAARAHMEIVFADETTGST